VNLSSLSATEIRGRVHGGELTAEAVTRAALQRIEALDGQFGAFLRRCDESALAAARDVDSQVAGGARPALAGVPIAVKDVLCTRGVTTTCASRILEHYVPVHDATAVARLREAGAIVVGKTNMDEFAMGSSNENSAFGPVRNPWDTGRVPGGSSGGSAAAVAARMTPLALGTDTGGSVRQPASLCGVVGLKPTYGRISRFGLIAFASSLDQIGPFSLTVRDCAAVLKVMAGEDSRDMTAARVAVPDYESLLAGGVKGLRIGVPREYFGAGLAPEVEGAVRAALATLTTMGAELQEVSLPHTEFAIPTYYIVANAEASSNLARFDGVRYGLRAAGAGDLEAMYRATRSAGFGAEVKRRIMLGTFVLAAGYYDAYYLKALQVRRLIRGDFEQAFGQVDLLAGPTAPETAFPLGAKSDDPLAMYLSDIYTATANLAGLPAISVPCGFGSGKLPIGLQLIAPHFAEVRLLRAAQALEEAIGWPAWRPALAGAA
jgi:aspartyl-tRNA(Asn)/glutamyl-tRNA(Gln) amidotransferase subunit A